MQPLVLSVTTTLLAILISIQMADLSRVGAVKMSLAHTLMRTPSMLNLLKLKLTMVINLLELLVRPMKRPSSYNASVTETQPLVELTLRPSKFFSHKV